MSYRLVNPLYPGAAETVQHIASAAFIPNDPDNKDWRDYQEWLAAGNTPEPAEEPPP